MTSDSSGLTNPLIPIFVLYFGTVTVARHGQITDFR